jgi:hypothetical protein
VASPARPRLLRSLDLPVTPSPQAAAGARNEVPFSPQDIAFSPGGSILASATGTDQVTVWNVTDPAHAYRLAAIDSPGDYIQALTFSPRGNLLAVLTYHGTVLVDSVADPARPAPPRPAACWPARATRTGRPSQTKCSAPAAAWPATRWRSPPAGTR